MENSLEFFEVADDLIRRAEVGFADDFDQRHAAAVVIHHGGIRGGVVHQLSRVLLHVNLVNADDLSAAVLGFNLNASVAADGEVELADLVRLGKVGIEVVLAVEFVVARDLAVQRESCLGRVFHNRLVE